MLIDYFDWAQERGIQYDSLTDYPIPIEHVKQIITEKNIAIRQGDILFMRTGTSPLETEIDGLLIYCRFCPGVHKAISF